MMINYYSAGNKTVGILKLAIIVLLFSASVFAGEPVKVSQHDGFGDFDYAFGPGGISKIAVDKDTEAEIISDEPVDAQHAVKLGASDIIVFCNDGKIYCFNTIVESLRRIERPDSLTSEMELTMTAEQAIDIFRSSKPKFGIINYSVLAVYLGALVWMGFYFSKKEKSTEDFFLAGRRIPAWAAGLSIFGTQLSAITFLAIPAKTYSSDWQYFLLNMAVVVVAAPVAAIIFIPFYRRINITTAYEYLERRFGLATRLLASVIYFITQLLRMGVVLFLPALALSTVSGMDVRLTIVLMGVLCTIYTVLGGIEAVIWTDVLQVFVLLAGALLCLVIILFDLGGDFFGLVNSSYDQGKFSIGQMNWDFTTPTLIVILIGFIGSFCPYVSDQAVVQRYLTTKTEKQAKKALWIGAWMSIPASLLFFALCTLLFMFYKTHPAKLDVGMSNDSIFPWFILQQLPAGVSGLLIAGVFAAAMSSLDSSMNSVSAVIVTDFIIRFKPSISQHRLLFIARLLTVLLGVFGTLTALVMTTYDVKSLWDMFSIIIGPFVGALGGLFLLGAVTKRCNAAGGLTGVITSVVVVYIIQFCTDIHFFLYTPIAIVVLFIVGYTISLFTGSNKDLTNLTLFTMAKNED